MIKIAGIVIPEKLVLYVGLMKIYGVGHYRSLVICNKSMINPMMKVMNLTHDNIVAINECLKEFYVEGELRSEIKSNIDLLIAINCYKGKRHSRRLPVRGQRTKSNARSARVSKKY